MDYQKLTKILVSTGKDSFSMAEIKEAINKIVEEDKKIMGSTLTFGKYKGKKIEEVIKFDKQYIEWIMKQPFFKKFEEQNNFIKKMLE